MCPVCTVGVAAGLGLSRWLKVDDAISGLWIGALILALAIWFWRWLYQKKAQKPLSVLLLLAVAFWLLTFLPFNYAGILEDCRPLWGMNRLILSSIIGVLVALLGIFLDKDIRAGKKGKAAFPYQKVVLPLTLLLLASLMMALVS